MTNLQATITLEQASAAFAAWENEARADPSQFYTVEEADAMEVGTLSDQRAICLFAYVRQVLNDKVT